MTYSKPSPSIKRFHLRSLLAVATVLVVAAIGIPVANAAPAWNVAAINDVVVVRATGLSPDTAATVTAKAGNAQKTVQFPISASGAGAMGFRVPRGYTGDVQISSSYAGNNFNKTVRVEGDGEVGANQSPTTSGPPSTSQVPSKPGTPTSTDATSMPVGDLPGWKQIFTEDFNTATAMGSWPGSAYSAKWAAYDGFGDTKKTGQYTTDIISVADGKLDMFLHTSNGTAHVAAPAPILTGEPFGGQTYGRYSVRFRADPVEGYKTAWLLWPDSDQWTAEIDFPEGELNGTISAFNHCPGNASENCFAKDTGASYNDWHVATVEWLPGSVKFYLDDKLIGEDKNAPSEPMHWVLQTETNFAVPPASSSGHVQIDWVTAYSRA